LKLKTITSSDTQLNARQTSHWMSTLKFIILFINSW